MRASPPTTRRSSSRSRPPRVSSSRTPSSTRRQRDGSAGWRRQRRSPPPSSVRCGRTRRSQLVANRAREAADADVAAVLLRHGGGRLLVEVVAGAAPADAAGTRVPTDGTVAGDVLDGGETVVLDNATDDERAAALGFNVADGWPELGAIMLLPLRSAGPAAGVLDGRLVARAPARVPVHPRRVAGVLRRAGHAGPSGRALPGGPRSARRVRGPRPDRPRPARPGDPAAVRGRPHSGERLPAHHPSGGHGPPDRRGRRHRRDHQGHPAHHLRAVRAARRRPTCAASSATRSP